MSANEQFFTGGMAPELFAMNAAVAHLPLSLHLEISDPEVVDELRKYSDNENRTRYAGMALRIGVLALRNARGQLDGRTIKEAGNKLIADVRELLLTRAANLTGDEYETKFRPVCGRFSRRR